MTCLSVIIKALEQFAPLQLAMDKDPIGLQAGKSKGKVTGILLALDVTQHTVEEAKNSGAELLITHHPAFYRGLKNLGEDNYQGKLAAVIVRNRLNIYSAHTNLDITPGGVADALADICGLCPKRQPLQKTFREHFVKLVTFVPESHLEKVRKAICTAGAGCYDKYTNCTFRTPGIGTFKGNSEASPFIGEKGKYEETPEWRLESRLNEFSLDKVEVALLKAHPYEVPAYDFTRLTHFINHGLGRVADIEKQTTALQLANDLSKKLKAQGVQLSGSGRKKIKRVAIWSGGGAPLEKSLAAGADVLITGECSYHEVLEAECQNLPIIKLGHGISEKVILNVLRKFLQKLFPNIKIKLSKSSVAPCRNI